MLQRVLEPEVMDTEADALEYEAIPNDEVNEQFTDELLRLCPNPVRCVDLGTGPGNIPMLIALKHRTVQIIGLDLSLNMLKLARRRVEVAGVSDRVQFMAMDIKRTRLGPKCYDVVFSNSIVHHIPKPLDVFCEAKRLATDDGLIFFKDLLRPDSLEEVDRLVEEHAADGTPYQMELFRSSLRASLTVSEVQQIADEAGLKAADVRRTSDRHWVLIAKS
jgi:ubiquinone/menaquinone biosynthesis C-methylase UbiE